MTLSDYDQQVKPHLIRIEVGAQIAAKSARALIARPNFETLAEQDLAEARKLLGNALALIVAAQVHYQNKKVEA